MQVNCTCCIRVHFKLDRKTVDDMLSIFDWFIVYCHPPPGNYCSYLEYLGSSSTSFSLNPQFSLTNRTCQLDRGDRGTKIWKLHSSRNRVRKSIMIGESREVIVGINVILISIFDKQMINQVIVRIFCFRIIIIFHKNPCSNSVRS